MINFVYILNVVEQTMPCFSLDECLPQPHHTRTYINGWSYTFGPHTKYNKGEHPWIYYEKDKRVVIPPTEKKEIAAPPAWLVADWMIMRHDGQPLPPLLIAYCDAPTSNKGLLWLSDYLRSPEH